MDLPSSRAFPRHWCLNLNPCHAVPKWYKISTSKTRMWKRLDWSEDLLPRKATGFLFLASCFGLNGEDLFARDIRKLGPCPTVDDSGFGTGSVHFESSVLSHAVRQNQLAANKPGDSPRAAGARDLGQDLASMRRPFCRDLKQV